MGAVKIYFDQGRAEIENRIKERKKSLRWDKTSHVCFAANQGRLFAVSLAYDLLHMIRDAGFWGESARPSIDSRIKRLVRLGPGWSTMPRSGTSMLRRFFF